MPTENLHREQRYHRLLSEALERGPDERLAFLASACGDDRELLDDLVKACSDDGALGDFLEDPVRVSTPALAEAAGLATEPPTPPTLIDRKTTETDVSTARATSVLARLRATRGVGAFLLLVLAMPILVGAAVAGTAAYLGAADPGLRYGSMTGKLVSATEIWPSVRPGDEIVAVQGVRVDGDPTRIREAFLALEPGPLTLGLRRGDEAWEVTAEVAPYSGAGKFATWTRVLTGSLLLAISAAAFVLRPGSRVTWLFLAFCTALGVHLLGYVALIRLPPEGLVVESLGLYLAAAAGLHLFTVFPRPLVGRRKWTFAFYVPPAAALLILPLYRVPAALGPVRTVIQIGNVLGALAALGAAGLVLAQHRRALRGEETITLARSRALLVAVLIGLAVPAVMGGLAVFVPRLEWVVNSFLVVVFVAIMGYSIVRHNAMEVDRFTAAVLGYGATTIVLGGAFGLVVIGVPALFGAAELTASPVVTAAMTATFFAVFHPLYRRIRKRVNRWFRREPVEEGTALRLFRQLTDSVRTSDLSTTFRVGLETAMSLQGERAELWTRTPDGGAFVRTSSGSSKAGPATGAPLPAASPLARDLAEASGGVAGLADQALGAEAQDELWRRELALASPIMGKDELRGFVGLGRKTNGTRYSRREREFLDTVASQLGIAMERDWEATERLGPYRVLSRLGTGGMAEVFLAEKHGPGGFERRVAVKRMLPHLSQDPGCVAMFLDEARIAARLHHPNIVQIYEIDKHEGSFYLAMELMDGPTLTDLLREETDRESRLPLPVAGAVAAAVLAALAYAHRTTDQRGRPLGLVHRDVKPGNILLGRHGEIKLTDFGIARAEFRLYQTEPGLARGTPAYMAPEQNDGVAVGPRADLFSAGAVIYEALCGKRAFSLGSRPSRPEPPTAIVPDLPPALDDFLRQALAERPEDRFDSAEEMRAAFLSAIAPARVASGEEVAAFIASFRPATHAESSR